MFEEANILYRKSVEFSQEVDSFIKDKISSSALSNVERVSWIILTDSRILSGQIIESLKRNETLIALIGLRALLESLINIVYIFENPELQSLGGIDRVCSDFMRRANDHEERKSCLDNKSVAQRAKLLPEYYEKMYVPICNFSHMLGFSPHLASQRKMQWFSNNALTFTLSSLNKSVLVIKKYFNLNIACDFEEELRQFEEKYSSDL